MKDVVVSVPTIIIVVVYHCINTDVDITIINIYSRHYSCVSVTIVIILIVILIVIIVITIIIPVTILMLYSYNSKAITADLCLLQT